MREVLHLQFDALSALLDGELPGQEAVAARAHLAACPSCQADVASLARLEDELRLPVALSCDLVAPFLSAVRDGEADGAEAAIASRHLAGCAGCRQAELAWTAVAKVLAGPLLLPSARVDHAMAALARGTSAPRGPRAAGIGPLGGIAWRGAVVAVLALAIAFSSNLAAAPADQPVATGPEASLAAAVQQVVLHARTNTLYVAQPSEGAVNALNATTYELRARIVVGGRPTALALDDSASRVIVLDAGAKHFTEIDIDRNAVVGTTAIAVAGTPTSVQVEKGKIVVFTSVAAKTPTASAAATTASGQVAVFDSGTKQLETVRAVDVAPRLVVPDPLGRRTLLVSPQATTVADASYRTIETLAGGVGAAFGTGDRIAVLSADGEGARMSFHGEGAPAAFRVEGRPAAVVALPDGGFAVLVQVGTAGRIVLVDAAGRESGTTDIAIAGRDLAYDAAARKFTVIAGLQVVSAALPASIAAQAPTASAAPSRAPAASTAPSPTASPRAATPSAPPIAAAPSPSTAGVPAAAVKVTAELYRVPLDSRRPVLVASTWDRVWFLDDRNQLSALDTATGNVFVVAQLPRDAVIRALAVGQTHVYAADVANARLFQLGIADLRVASYQLPVVDVSAMTVAPEGTVWVAMPGSSRLLAFHPLTKRVEEIDVGVKGSVALAADVGGRLWFSNGSTAIGTYDAVARRLSQFSWPGQSAPTVLLADRVGRVWAGTASGEVYVLSGSQATLATRVSRPISALAIDLPGQVWYLAPAAQASGFSYQPVSGSQAARAIPGPATSLTVNQAGRAWLADPLGGFYLGLESQR